MNEDEVTLRHARSPGTWSRRANPGTFSPALILALGCLLLQACALAPAVLVASAAITTAGIAVEAEKAVPDGDVPDSITVKGGAKVHAGPGEQYSRIATLHEGDEVSILREEEDWIECCGEAFSVGWIHRSRVPNGGD